MLLAVYGCRKNAVESVYPKIAGKCFIRLLQPEPHLVQWVKGEGVRLCLAVSECRGLAEREAVRQGQAFRRVIIQGIGGIVPYAEPVFKKSDHGI